MLPALFEYLSRVRLKCPTLTNNHHHTDDVTVPHKSLRIQGCSAADQMSTERGGVLKTRAEHFARHLNTRLRSLSETEDGSWSAAGEQLSISSSSDNDVFYDIESSLASPQEEAAEPQFINQNHDNLSDNSEDYTASDSTATPFSNGPATDDSSDIHFYDIISQREDLSDCTDQISEECADCYKRDVMKRSKQTGHSLENHINGTETENECNNMKNRSEMIPSDGCMREKGSCDISYPKYSRVWREDSMSQDGALENSEKWDDVDLTVVQDNICRCSTTPAPSHNGDRESEDTECHEEESKLPSAKDIHHSHNGDQEAEDNECHEEESKLPSAKDIHHSHNGDQEAEDNECHEEESKLPSAKDIHHCHNRLALDFSASDPTENEGASQISQTEIRNNGEHEVLNTNDTETESSGCIPSTSNLSSNERLEDLTDNDNNLSLSELLHVLQKEYKNKCEPCVSSSYQDSETKVNYSSQANSDATQTEDDLTLPSNHKVTKHEEEEEEDIEIRRLRFRRCSSLKSGKTPPGTPGRKKIVRFADVLGLDLADVKTFLDEIPTVPKSAYKDLHDIELSSSPMESAFAISQPPQRSERVLLPLFQQPVGQPFFLDRVRDNNVCLENAVVSDPVLFAITGTVRVKNIDFHKSVHIRYSIDNWKSFADLQARYVPNSCDGFSDKFSFLLYAHTLDVGNRLEFAVRFQAKGVQYWDNNGGTNYVFQCVNKESSASSVICVQAASHYTLHSPIDTWPTFY